VVQFLVFIGVAADSYSFFLGFFYFGPSL